jgi:hypothetical protein
MSKLSEPPALPDAALAALAALRDEQPSAELEARLSRSLATAESRTSAVRGPPALMYTLLAMGTAGLFALSC